jgi:hypothetical protein
MCNAVQIRLSVDITADPAESSFAKAMAASVGTLSILDKDGTVFTRIWCGLARLISTLIYPQSQLRTHHHTRARRNVFTGGRLNG